MTNLQGSPDIFPQNISERLFAIAALSLAVVAFPYFISSITSKIVQLQGISIERSKAKEQLQDLLSRRGITLPLAAAARFHLQHHFTQRHRATEDHVLKLLPELLQVDLRYEMRAPLLRCSRFLKHLDSKYSALAKRLCGSTLVGRWASPDEIIFAQGDPCNEAMCFEEGSVCYLHGQDCGTASWSERAQQVSEAGHDVNVRAPSWFCEAALWVSWHNLGSLRSSGHSSLTKLDALVLRKEVSHFPKALTEAVCYARFYAAGISDIIEEFGLHACTDRGLDYDNAIHRHVHLGISPINRSRSSF